MQNRVNILFPVEIVNRELDFRLFLACLTANPNNRVWLGEHSAIYRLLQYMRGGLYVGKDIFLGSFPSDLKRYKTLKAQGFSFIHLEEEGGVYNGGPETWEKILTRRLDPRVMAEDDHVCTWGDFQRDFYRSFEPACKDNIVTTGHPRFDLYKEPFREFYAADAARYRERYGDFLLINTNITRANYIGGLSYWFHDRKRYNPQDFDNRSALINHWAHNMNIWGNFVKLINRLSHDFPDLNIVIRPHPTEDSDNYRAFFSEFPNVHVVHEGGVGGWLFACKAMLHDGCTTGIEAHFSEVPIINYKSVVDERYDLFLPNLFGRQCFSEDEVIGAVRDLQNGERASFISTAEALDPLAKSIIDNFEHNGFEQLLTIIRSEEEKLSPGSFDRRGWKWRERSRRFEYGVKAKLNRRGERKPNKFYGFNNVPLDEKLPLIQRITGTHVHHHVLTPELMMFEAH